MSIIFSNYKKLFQDKEFFNQLIPLALPVAFQNLISSLGSMGIGLLIGQLGDTALAGTSIASPIQFLLILACFGIGTSAGIFSSRFWGSHNRKGVQQTQGVSVALSTLAGILFALPAILFTPWIVGLFTPDPAIRQAGISFLQISALAFPFLGASTSYAIILRTVGDTKTPLHFSILSLVVQIIVSLALIFGWGIFPALGIRGAAIGFVAAKVLETIGLIVVCQIKKTPNSGTLKELFSFDAGFLLSYVKLAIPVVISEILWATGMGVVKAIYGWMGTVPLASYAVMESFTQIAFIVFFATGNSESVLIGQSIGRNDIAQAKRYAKNCALLAPLMGLILTLPMALAAPFLPYLMDVTPEVRSTATVLLLLFAVLLPGKAFYHDMIVGVLRSGGDVRFSLVMDQSGVWLWAIPMGALFAFVFHWPFPLVYFLINLEEPAKSLLALWRLKTGKWLHKTP